MHVASGVGTLDRALSDNPDDPTSNLSAAERVIISNLA